MTEGGLAVPEVGKEISEHRGHHQGFADRHERVLAVVEASLLAVVAVLAAWSGYASAKWNTDSRLLLARSSTARVEASNAELKALNERNFDASTFTVWFVAHVAGNTGEETVAARRFTPNFRAAFNAWMATHPDANPNAPAGPTYMPQYKQPGVAQANGLDRTADHLYAEGATAADHADSYIRLTVYLATVLFLIAISGHFRVRGVRIGLIAVGVVVLVLSMIQLAGLPFPPS